MSTLKELKESKNKQNNIRVRASDSKKIDAGISKDKETEFHSKLDTLVHKTFGKMDNE